MGQRLRAQTIPGKKRPGPTPDEWEDDMNSEHSLPPGWDEIVREAGSFLSECALAQRPRELPTGRNFVTPDVLGYWEAQDGTPAEISTGVMLGGRQLGVTFPRVRDENGILVPDPRDRCCWSWQEVRVALGYGDGEP